MGRTSLVAVLAVIAVSTAGCSARPDVPDASGGVPDSSGGPARLRVEVLRTVPHDPTAFTQGLELADGVLYEGTGIEGESVLRTVDPATGAERRRVDLPDEFFGEGITVVGPRIWQLTWRNHVAIERDRATLAERGRVDYPGEGWGLCHDAAAGRLVMSDGSDRLTFRDPTSFERTGEVPVTSAGRPVQRLNELECAHGSVFANVWQTDTIVRIDPASGRVTAELDLTGLLPADERARADVLNGIAAVPGTDEFLVTGKYWPKMYRVKFVA